MNDPVIMEEWEKIFERKIAEIATPDDPAHDQLHFHRVVRTAKKICQSEKGDPQVVIPAAWLHDFVIVPKNDPRRSMASRMSAAEAVQFLVSIQYPKEHLMSIAHAIEAHSFSANIAPVTLEARIVQDADRLDGLGAIGVARCFATAGILKRPFYNDQDPFCKNRQPDDVSFTLDHFFQKLFKTAKTLQTETGRAEGHKRVLAMKNYLQDLASEI